MNNPLNHYKEILKSTNDTYGIKYLEALFFALSTSLTAKNDHYMIKENLDRQYYSRLMTHADYVEKTTGLNGIKKKYDAFIFSVMNDKKYQKFNSKNKIDDITTLDDWVGVIELLYGFVPQYKAFLVPDDKETTTDIINDLTRYCKDLTDNDKCTYPEPCCRLSEHKIDSELIKKLNEKINYETQNDKNKKNFIYREKMAQNMAEWLYSYNDLDEKYKLYKKSITYKKFKTNYIDPAQTVKRPPVYIHHNQLTNTSQLNHTSTLNPIGQTTAF